MSKLKDIIDLTLTEDNITETMEGDNERHPIIVKLEKKSTLSDSETEIISENLKRKFLDEVIASYKINIGSILSKEKLND